MLLLRVTTIPPAGAGPANVAVPVALFPPAMVAGLTVTVAREFGTMVSTAVLVMPAYVAEIDDEALAVTTTVVMVNLALLAPAATVTLAGTVATAVLVLARLTTTPPVGALPVSVAVPLTAFPPAVLVGLSVSDDKTGGTTVRSRKELTPL